MNIVLIGFKGAGKTALGKHLSLTLHRNFYDSDKVLEYHYYLKEKKRSKCRDIFQTHGEDYFRTLEKEAIEQLSEKKQSVIALGGGSLNVMTEDLIADLGTLVYLSMPEELVRTRQTTHSAQDFEPIFQERKRLFEKYADHTIDGDYYGI